MNTDAGILICIEDSEERANICMLLRSMGFGSTVGACDIKDAEDRMRSGDYGVMVVDTAFGGAGMQLVRNERRRTQLNCTEFPELVVIAGAGQVKEAVGLPVGALLISRPYESAELVRLILDAVKNCAVNSARYRADSKKPSEQDDDQLEVQISGILHSVGIPAHIKGYTYLRCAITMTVKDPDVINFVTKSLYPSVASKCGTTSTRVERAIRHAIEVAWDRGDVDVLDSYFGYTISRQRGKPTNSEFIAMIADKIRLGVIR